MHPEFALIAGLLLFSLAMRVTAGRAVAVIDEALSACNGERIFLISNQRERK
jgi:hypothetical protein